MQTYTLIGIIAVLFVFIKLIRSVGKTLPLLDLTFLIAGSQWIIGPYIDYTTGTTHFKYYMYVTENEYMSIITPMYLALITPYYLLKRDIKFNLNIEKYNSIGFPLIIIGTISSLLVRIVPSSLSFVFFLLSNMLFVGSGILILQKKSIDKKWAYAAFLWLIYSSISSGFFHILILWSMFLFFLIAMKFQLKWYHTMVVFIVGFMFIAVIQSIKHDFRTKLTTTSNPIELFSELILASFYEGVAGEDKDVNELNVRLNQGWIISAIIKHVPEKEPYADGSTIYDAITASLIPRILNSNKKKAGGRENFMKYTGLIIGKSTSMGMSIIGESYANFGKKGGLLFMFIWGMFLTLFWNKIQKLTYKNNIVLFFIPLIFLQVVKAETELLVVLNHLVKASIICYISIWYLESKYNLSNNE